MTEEQVAPPDQPGDEVARLFVDMVAAREVLERSVPAGLAHLERDGGAAAVIASHLRGVAVTLELVGRVLEDSRRQETDDPLWRIMRWGLAHQYVDNVKQLGSMMVDAVTRGAPPFSQVLGLIEAASVLSKTVGEWGNPLVPEEMRRELEMRTSLTSSSLEGLSVWRLAQTAAETAVEAADAAKEAAGRQSTVSLATEFEALRDSERNAANWFRRIALALYGLTVALGAAVAIGASRGSLDVEQSLLRLGAGIPVLALGVYLGHESNGHRRTAAWAAVLVAQLRSVRAYSQQLSDEGREELMAVFGRRVFLDSPNSESGADTTPPTGLDVVAIMREAGALVQRAGNPPGSGPGS